MYCYFQVFQKDGFDYFTDMMPALHNYVTVDTPIFLLYENYVLAMFNMCKAVSVLFVCFQHCCFNKYCICWCIKVIHPPEIPHIFHMVCGVNVVKQTKLLFYSNTEVMAFA